MGHADETPHRMRYNNAQMGVELYNVLDVKTVLKYNSIPKNKVWDFIYLQRSTFRTVGRKAN